MEEKKKFLLDLIDSYRRIIKKPLDREDYNIKTSSDLQAPLQISLLWFRSEINDLQLFLSNHNKDFPDKCIDIFGPYNMNKKSHFQSFESTLNKGHVFKYIGDVEDEADLKKTVIWMIRNKIDILKKDPTYEINPSGVFYKECFYFYHNGNIFIRSIDEILNYYQKEKIKDERFVNDSKNLPLDYKMVPYFAGYINPPVWIGEVPNLTMEEQIKGKPLNKFVKTVYKAEILDRKIIIKNDGFLGISLKGKVDEMPDMNEFLYVIKILNFLFSVFLIMGIKIVTVQASEFVWTTYLPEKDFLAETHRDYSKSKELFDKRYKSIDIESFEKFRSIISLDELIKGINLAKKLISNRKLCNSLLLLIHSYSNILNSEYNQSFILSWTILEQYLNYIWDLLLDKELIRGDRRKKLRSIAYTASVKTEMLNLLGLLSKENLDILNDLRSKRNKLMHEVKQISSEDAFSSLKLALNYSKARIDDYIQESKVTN